MTANSTVASPEPNQEPISSRRGFLAGAITIAAVAEAASTAEAQGNSNARHFNPQGMSTPAQYSHVVEVE